MAINPDDLERALGHKVYQVRIEGGQEALRAALRASGVRWEITTTTPRDWPANIQAMPDGQHAALVKPILAALEKNLGIKVTAWERAK